MDNDILTWWGNFINFLVLVYVTTAVVNTVCFDDVQLGVTVFGLVVSIAIGVKIGLMRK